MSSALSTPGGKPRLTRVFRSDRTKALIVPMDHPVSNGPITGKHTLDELVGQIVEGGADAVIMHKGAVGRVDPRRFLATGLIVHLSAGTDLGGIAHDKYLVSTVESALRLGADAVSVHVNLGSDTERDQVRALAQTAESCERWQMPLLAMVYPRGPRIEESDDPALLAHAAILAADLGADLVKIPFARTTAEMTDVVGACPIPVLVAGGPRQADETAVLARVDEVCRSEAAGMAMGRNLFEHPDVVGMTARVAAKVHSSSAVHPSLFRSSP